MTEGALKQRLSNNISKYFENIDSSADIKIDITKGRRLASHSKHLHCLIKIKTRGQNVRREYIFAKYANKTEFDNLLKIQSFYQNANIILKIPKPLDYYTDSKILILEGIKGENLLLHLLINLLPFMRIINRRSLEHTMRLCAAWLAEFHNLTYIRNVENLKDELEIAFKRLEMIPYFNKQQKKDLMNRLVISNGSVKCLPMTLTNRDFSPRNIIFDNKNGIKVVDWAKIIEKNIYYSIAYFFTNLESRARHYIYSLNYIKTLEQLFWDEYRKKSKFNVNKVSFKFMKILYNIEYLYEYYTKTGVFEEWIQSTRAMNIFVNQIANNLLDG
ncbi:MAG: hypothetical protein Q8O30_09570 [Candidatus Omnitrophota bacterium]|nr:hypothetical protein [Candidatus Omnitrophota bacterium]